MRRVAMSVFLLLGVALFSAGCGDTAPTTTSPPATNTSPTSTPAVATATATAGVTGKPVLTFSGGDTLDSGPARSATFSVGTDASWHIQYTCTTAADFDSGFLIFDVHNGNGTGADMSGPLGPTTCPKGTSQGTATVSEAPNGVAQSRYLEVTAHGATWTLTVIA